MINRTCQSVNDVEINLTHSLTIRHQMIVMYEWLCNIKLRYRQIRKPGLHFAG